MKKDYLLNDEDLIEALKEYLMIEQSNKYTHLEEKKYILPYDDLINNTDKNTIYIKDNYKTDKTKLFNITNDSVIIPQGQKKNYQTFYGPTSAEEEAARIKFLQDDTQVLTILSPLYLRGDGEVILTSITRDINSIAYAYNITDEIKQTAIIEAKRQGYVFQANTPLFMLHNKELIRQSIEKNINTINLVPREAWTNELATFAYQLALKNGYILSSDSPRFFRTNVELIKQTLKLDINSRKYIIWEELNSNDLINIERYIVDNQLNYIINYRSPINFKRNTNICLLSSKNDPNSVTYFDWSFFDKNNEEKEKIINALIEQKYVLNHNSPEQLRSNTKLCLSSIKIDLYSAGCFSKEIQDLLTDNLDKLPVETQEDIEQKNRLYEIRHYLIENGYYSLEEFLKFPVSVLKDEFLLDYYLEQEGIHKDSENEKNNIFYDRVKFFINTTVSSSLKVSDARKVFQMVAQKKWEEYRRENNDYYANIFNRICDSLEKNSNFISALNELKFLKTVDYVLDERKYALFNAFLEYHQIFHNSNDKNKIELLQAKRDEISKYAALFISKSKEDYISQQMKLYDEQYKQFFTIRTDNPIVRKKVVEIKQRDMLKKLFNSRDESLMQRLETIKSKYLAYNYNPSIIKDKIPQILDLFISQSINNNVSSIDDVLSSSKPARFDEYENFEKVSKLINRLNSHNISFEGQEVRKYRDFIVFDGEKYVYNGNGFSDNELAQIMGYKDLKYVFGKIKSEIIQIAKGIDKFDTLTQEDIKHLIGECPFTDEYYKFDPSIFDKLYLSDFNSFLDSFDNNKEIILNDDCYKKLQQLVLSNDLIMMAKATELGWDTRNSAFDDIIKYVNMRQITSVISSIPTLTDLLTSEELTIDNLNIILDFKDIFKYGDLKQFCLLGKEVIKKIYSDDAFTSSTKAERINVACDLLTAMAARKESTVPYINGTYHNYRYSMYDSTDETLLTTGLDTNACFRCCGNDNDFLHYCALDKNGFVIKLTDSEGNFIGRASGFRNGNGIYINQLRTIYDKKSSAYRSEQETIIRAFEQACNDIVETSQKNPNEKNKIEFVVVTKSYTIKDVNPNVNGDTIREIGYCPMDNTSEDWENFIKNTNNLMEAKSSYDYFTTDFGYYALICIKSAIGELTPDKIKRGDVPALYMRKRKQISVEKPNKNTQITVNRIRAMYSHQTRKKFKYIIIPQDCKIVSGDNWYAILRKQGIIDSCYLPNDEFAKQEFNAIMKQLLANMQTTLETVEDIPIPSAKK